MSSSLSWIETDLDALAHNVATFRARIGSERRLMIVVKANAYGHGIAEVGLAACRFGADWLGVFTLDEALCLRSAGVTAPILVFGPVPVASAPLAAAGEIRLTVPSPEYLEALLASGVSGLSVHAKVETGTNRQGLFPRDLACLTALAGHPRVTLEGLYTHFADIEDTTEHQFAETQLERFRSATTHLAEQGLRPPLLHTACTAAALLFEETYFNMVRVGIGAYGLWPSKETRVSATRLGVDPVNLRPLMTWKTRISQIKTLEPGEYVGYGRTWRARRLTRLAILPVGYANGYDRGLSNHSHVLVRGQRAPLCGRVMMNMCAVDVTDLPDALAGDEVVLLGRQGEECIPADMLAGWLGTINYEVVTRAEPFGPRICVGGNETDVTGSCNP